MTCPWRREQEQGLRGRRLSPLGLALILILATFSIGSGTPARDRPKNAAIGAEGSAPGERPRRVLMLHSHRADLPSNVVLDRILRSTLAAGRVGPIDFYTEYLDVSRFPGDDHAKLQSEFLRRRYADRKLDVVITISDPAVDFLVQYGAGLFPGTPIVVGSTAQRGIRNWPLPPGITGAVGVVQFKTTLELALALHPETRRVVVAAGSSTIDRQWAEQTFRDLQQVAPDVEVIDTGQLSMLELLRHVASQPPHTIIFYHAIFRDGAGELFVPADVVPPLARVANAPIYGVYDTLLGLGIVGGHLWSFESQGLKASEIALRILRRERAQDIPLVRYDPHVYMFDWRQLQRWGIDGARLPTGSVIRFREESVWGLYSWYIAGAVAVVVTQSALIAGLLVARARRRRAEADARRQREELAHVLRVTTMSELTASIAHEISQPLGAILTNAQAARRLLGQGPSQLKEVEDALADIAADSRRASEVIRRLRAMFRKQHVELVAVDANALIEGVVGLLHTDLLVRGINVRRMLDEAAPTVLGDPIQLEQVVLNLLVNACEAVAAGDDEGPLEITIQTSQPEAGRLAIAISDTGVGVKDTELERIFEHYVSSKPKGLGMGLAISRSIVEAHGGRIWATPNTDRGLTLHVELPTRARATLAG
ncbi:MAG: sensor histidine kinase [Candidatus Rokuibacteriota bacterium]